MKDSVVFYNHFSNAPYTSLSFYTMMTSRIPTCSSRHNEPCSLPSYIPVLAEILYRNNYFTVALQDSNPFLTPHYGYNRGFRLFIDYIGYENRSIINSFTLGRIIDKVIRDHRMDELLKYYTLSLPRPIQGSHNILHDAVEVLDKLCDLNTRFFMWIHLVDMHGPHTGRGFPNGIRLSYALRRLYHRGRNICMTISDLELLRILYQQDLLSIDESFGMLLDRLRDRQCLDKLMIILTADHGEEFCDHGGYGHTAKLYNELVRVPLIIRLPGENPRVHREPPSSHLDLLPTILGVLGIKTKDRYLGKPLVINNGVHPRDFHDRRIPLLAYSSTYHVLGFISNGYKIIAFFHPDRFKPYRVEIYDLRRDPLERENLIGYVEKEFIDKLVRAMILIRKTLFLKKIIWKE